MRDSGDKGPRNAPRFIDQLTRDNYLVVAQLHRYLKLRQKNHKSFPSRVYKKLDAKFDAIQDKYADFVRSAVAKNGEHSYGRGMSRNGGGRARNGAGGAEIFATAEVSEDALIAFIEEIQVLTQEF